MKIRHHHFLDVSFPTFLDPVLARELGIQTEPLLVALQVRALDGHIFNYVRHRTKPVLVTMSERVAILSCHLLTTSTHHVWLPMVAET